MIWLAGTPETRPEIDDDSMMASTGVAENAPDSHKS